MEPQQLLGTAAIATPLYPTEIRAALAGCASLIKATIRSVVYNIHQSPDFVRIEPVLEMADRNREPVIDLDAEEAILFQQLRSLSRRVIYDGIASPVGRSADQLTITIDGEDIATITHADKIRQLDFPGKSGGLF